MRDDKANTGVNPAIHFGRQVRKARREKGWTIRELAAKAGISGGHLSNIENGKRGVSERRAQVFDRLFPDRRGWFSEYHQDSQIWAPPGYRDWAAEENKAAHLRVWCPGALDGLVQTGDYARALFETVPGVPPAVINARVAARLERQKRILHRRNPPSVWIGVDEVALYRLVGSSEIMASALDNLLAVARLPHVTVQIMPIVGHGATGSELIVADSAAAYCEHLAGSYTYTDDETVAELDRTIVSIQSECYRASETVRMIERARDIWARGGSPLTAMLREGRA